MSTVVEALSQPVWQPPGATPPSLAAFIAFTAFVAYGATAFGASFGVVTAPLAILSVVTARRWMFFALTLFGFSLHGRVADPAHRREQGDESDDQRRAWAGSAAGGRN